MIDMPADRANALNAFTTETKVTAVNRSARRHKEIIGNSQDCIILGIAVDDTEL